MRQRPFFKKTVVCVCLLLAGFCVRFAIILTSEFVHITRKLYGKSFVGPGTCKILSWRVADANQHLTYFVNFCQDKLCVCVCN